MPVTADSAALPGKTFNGTITAVDNKIDPDSRTLQVQATLPNADGVIKSGMSFSVDMTFPGETFPAVDPLSIQWSNQRRLCLEGRRQQGRRRAWSRSSSATPTACWSRATSSKATQW